MSILTIIIVELAFLVTTLLMSYSPNSPLISRLASTNLGNDLGKHIGNFPKCIHPMCYHPMNHTVSVPGIPTSVVHK